MSEAFYLKKPILVMPINHQFEQIINGQFVEKLGVGVSKINISEKDIIDFLKNLEFYNNNFKNYNPGNQKETLKKIENEVVSLIDS